MCLASKYFESTYYCSQVATVVCLIAQQPCIAHSQVVLCIVWSLHAEWLINDMVYDDCGSLYLNPNSTYSICCWFAAEQPSGFVLYYRNGQRNRPNRIHCVYRDVEHRREFEPRKFFSLLAFWRVSHNVGSLCYASMRATVVSWNLLSRVATIIVSKTEVVTVC